VPISTSPRPLLPRSLLEARGVEDAAAPLSEVRCALLDRGVVGSALLLDADAAAFVCLLVDAAAAAAPAGAVTAATMSRCRLSNFSFLSAAAVVVAMATGVCESR
jgi:hypothetical protein